MSLVLMLALADVVFLVVLLTLSLISVVLLLLLVLLIVLGVVDVVFAIVVDDSVVDFAVSQWTPTFDFLSYTPNKCPQLYFMI